MNITLKKISLDKLFVRPRELNKELFQIGLVDCPCVRVVQRVDRPRVEPSKRGVVPGWTWVES